MSSFATSPIHVDRPLSNFATAYSNHKLIGTLLAPEVPVEFRSDKYYKRNRANGMRYLGQPVLSSLQVPAEIEQGLTLDNFACEDYGLMGTLAVADEKLAPTLKLREDVVLDVTSRLLLAQEARIAALFTNASNYDSSTVKTLVGADRWDAGGGDPLGVIDELKAAIWPAENTKLVVWMGEAVWRVLKRHPALVGLISGGATANMPSIVMRAKIAELLEVDEVLVGEAWSVTSNPAVADTTARIWGKSFGIARVSTMPSTRCLHFATSFVWGGRNVTDWLEPAPGLFGAWKHKVTHSTDEKVIAGDAGALVVTPIS